MNTPTPDAQSIVKALACGKPGCECAATVRRGSGRTHCPAHADPSPSLNITSKLDGTVLFHCHAGCDQDKVIAELRDRDLWPQRTSTRPTAEVRSRTTDYLNKTEAGDVEAIHRRTDHPDGTKTVIWVQPDGRTIGLKGRRVDTLPLYGIDRLNGAASVVITEGEKACDALLSQGIEAVGTVTGAKGTPGDAVLEPLLRTKTVILWPDHDAPGWKHSDRIASRLVDLGHPDVRVIEWMDAPPSGDAADASPTEMLRLLEAAKPWSSAQRFNVQEGSSTSRQIIDRPVGRSFEVVLLEYSGNELVRQAIENPTLTYLPFLELDGYIVEGWSHLLAGYPRVGKTELLARLVASWSDRAILLITEEPVEMWAKRVACLSGDWSHLRVVFGLGFSPDLLLDRAFSGDEDVVIVDTVRNLLGLHDEKDNSEIARRVNPWVAKSRSTGKTLIMGHHNRKGGGHHGEGIAGGHALLAAFDIALEVLHDGQSANRRVVKGYPRLITIPDLIYEMNADNELVALGDPAALKIDAVKQRVRANLGTEWELTKVIHESLSDPRPSPEQVRQALSSLAMDGAIERNPPIHDGTAQGKTHRWRLGPPTDGGDEQGPEPLPTDL